MRLDGKIALISGAARGLGLAQARLFASEGAKVILGDVLEKVGQAEVEKINEAEGEALFVKLDVTKEADWKGAVGIAEKVFGKLDVLVNNAGVFHIGSIEDTGLAIWENVMNVNNTGVFLGTKAVIPAMRRAGGGSIVNISSTSGLVGSPNTAAYHASKGAVRIFTKAAAIECASSGIRVNSVHPGPIETDMIASVMKDPQYVERQMGLIPSRRFGRAEDVAFGVLFLASDESSFMTGAELVIDGGKTAR